MALLYIDFFNQIRVKTMRILIVNGGKIMMKKIFRYSATLIIASFMVFLLTGCAEDELPTSTGAQPTLTDELPIPTDEAVLAAARESEVPVIELWGAWDAEWFEHTIFGRYFPEFNILIREGTLLAWNLNGQNLRLPQACEVLRPVGETLYRTNELKLVEGENELIIWAIGPTRLIVERRLIITSNQTIPEEQRTAMPHLNDVTISYYDPEFPTIVTVAFEFIGDYYGDVLRASAYVSNFIWGGSPEDVDVTDKEGGVFEVTVELIEEEGADGLNIAVSRFVTITLENEWNVPSQGSAAVIISNIGDGIPRVDFISCSNWGMWGLPEPPRWD